MTVSVCFPWRADDGHRDRLAAWILKRWELLFPDYQLLKGACDDGPFNRSQAINEAFSRSSGDIIIVADLDTIFRAMDVREAVAHVEKDPNSWGFGFTDYIKLTAECTEQVLSRPAEAEFHIKSVDAYESSQSTMSGLLFITKEGFEKVGGFDAGFVGWGYEDSAFTQVADRKLSHHFRVPGGYLLHLEHDEPPKIESTARNSEYFEEKYLGLFKPEPKTLPAGFLDVPYADQQFTVEGRVPPYQWSATGLPLGLELAPGAVLCGTPQRHEMTTVVVSVADAENVTVTRTYGLSIAPTPFLRGKLRVAVYCNWDEPFAELMFRLRRATPGLGVDNVYKSLWFVPPEEEHRHGLVFNAVRDGDRLFCKPKDTYVIIMEPPEILGADHKWLTTQHPQHKAHIFMFGGGSVHEEALGLHIPQATLSPSHVLPSSKQRRCSMICSDSDRTPYHKKRRQVLAALRETVLDIDFYGRGMAKDPNDSRVKGPINTPTKDYALRPYSFVIDFENTHRDVMTDKFIDPILNGCVPITNSTGAAKVFPKGSFEFMDFDWSVEQIVGAIEAVITQPAFDLIRYDAPVSAAKRLVSTGSVNICEWMYQQIGVPQ